MYNATNNQIIEEFNPLLNGTTIDLAKVGNKLNITANTDPTNVGSVQFLLNSEHYSVENEFPYALNGDISGNFKDWTPELTTYTITAIPFEKKNQNGAIGTPQTIVITFIDSEAEKEDNEGCDYFEERNGLIVIEAEHLNYSSYWEVIDDENAYGGQYLTWNGNNENNKPGKGEINTTIKINTPGRYEFLWRMKQSEESTGDEANSTWVDFPDALFVGVDSNFQMIFKDYVKVFGHAKNEFGWSSIAYFDQNNYQTFVEFDQAGYFTMKLAARSAGHQLDRIILFNRAVEYPEATFGGQQETICNDTEEDTCVDNQLPSVNIIDPISNSVFPSDAQILVKVNAMDEGGIINKVELYRDDLLIGTDNQAPYEFEININEVGAHILEAIAYDDCASLTISNEVQVQVQESPKEEMAIIDFTLYNANTNLPVLAYSPLSDGDTLDLAVIGTDINVVANTNDNLIGSVAFLLNGKSHRIENVAPYAMVGDVNGRFYSWSPKTGSYTIKAIPYGKANQKGKQGKSAEITIYIINPEQEDLTTSTAGFNIDTLSNQRLIVFQNYPNPFQERTTISFEIFKSERVTLTIRDVFGKVHKRIMKLLNRGKHEIVLDATEFSSGIFYYSVEVDNQRSIKAMIITK